MGAGCSAGGGTAVHRIDIDVDPKPPPTAAELIDDGSDSDDGVVTRRQCSSPGGDAKAKASVGTNGSDRDGTTNAGTSPSLSASPGKHASEKEERSPSPSDPEALKRASYLNHILTRLNDPEEREAMLTEACASGDTEVIQAVVLRCTRGGRQLPNEILFDTHGNSLLHKAAQHGHLSIVDCLLELGCVEADIPNAQNATPLILAARAGAVEVVVRLLCKDADPNHADHRKHTAFLAAAFKQHLQVMAVLLEAGADVSAADERGITALHAAVTTKSVAAVEWLLQRGCPVDARTAQQTTALMMAARQGHVELVQALVWKGADLALADAAGSTALHLAANSGDADCVRALLSAEAPRDKPDSGGRTPALFAIYANAPLALQALVDAGARTDVLDEEGCSPLFRAVAQGPEGLPLVETLLAARADPNLHSSGAAVAAASMCEGEVEGCNVEACLKDARTPLQLAALTGRMDAVELLLEAASLDKDLQAGSFRYSALHLAVVGNREDIAQLLCAKGAKSCLDTKGRSPAALDAALERKWTWPELEEKKDKRAVVSLPALAPKEKPTPGEDPSVVALAEFKSTWTAREAVPGDVLDAVMSPVLHDAFLSSQWRTREAAMQSVKATVMETTAGAEDLLRASMQIAALTADDKVAKVFLASLELLDEVLGHSAVAELPEARLLELAAEHHLLDLLLEKTESSTSQVARHALDQYLALVYSGLFSLEAVVLPLVVRLRKDVLHIARSALQDRLADEAGKQKRLASLLKVVLKVLQSFGLSESGVFRRGLLLPMLLICVQHPSDKVRAKALEAVLQVVHLSGGIPEEAYAKLRPSVPTAVNDALAKQGPRLVAFAGHADDTLPEAELASPGAPPMLAMAQLPHLNAEMVEKLLASPSAAAAELRGEAELRGLLGSRAWQDREAVAKDLRARVADGEPTVPTDPWTSSADPKTSAWMLFGGLRTEFFLEASKALVHDQVAAVFAAALDLLMAMCDRVSRQQLVPDLAERVFPTLLDGVFGPLVAKMTDASSRVRRKATNALMYVATFGEAAGGDGAPLLVQRVLQDAGKNTVLPRMQVLKQMLGRPSVATALPSEVQRAVLQFLVAHIEHRVGDVRQLALKCIVQAADHWAGEVEALVGSLDPKSQQRRALRKVGLERRAVQEPSTPCHGSEGGRALLGQSPGDEAASGVSSGHAAVSASYARGTHLAPGSASLGDPDTELPFAEPISEEAREFVQPLIDLFGDNWARCWYSPQWQLRVASLTYLSPRLDSYVGQDPDTAFDGLMRVLNEGLGDQVVKVYFSAAALLPQVLTKFAPLLDAQLVRAHVAPLLLHLMSRMGDSKEQVRTKTTQTLFAVLASGTAVPTTVAKLILDHLSGVRSASLGPLGEAQAKTEARANSVHGWMCRLSVLRDLVRDYDVCATLGAPAHWLGALVPGVSHGSVAVRGASQQLFAQVYKRCTQDGSMPDKKQEWVEALAGAGQAGAKLKNGVVVEDSDKENERPPEAPAAKPGRKQEAFKVRPGLAAFARRELADLTPLETPNSEPERVVQSLKFLAAAVPWGSLKHRADTEKGLPSDLETFEQLCDVLKTAFETKHQAVFQAAAQLCCAMLHHSQVSSLDVHMSVGAIFPPLLAQTGSANTKMAMAADKTVLFLAKHPRIGAEAVARQVLGAMSRCAHTTRLLALLLRLVGEFGAYLCFQRQLVALMLEAVAPLLSSRSDEDNSAVRSQISELVQRCQQLQPSIFRTCLREMEGPARQALAGLADSKKGGELCMLQEADTRSDPSTHGSPVKMKRASRYRNAKPDRADMSPSGWQTPELMEMRTTTASTLSSQSSWPRGPEFDAPVGASGVRRLRQEKEKSGLARPPLPPLRTETNSRGGPLNRSAGSDLNPLDLSRGNSRCSLAEERPPESESEILRPRRSRRQDREDRPAALREAPSGKAGLEPLPGLDVLMDSLDSKERKSKTR